MNRNKNNYLSNKIKITVPKFNEDSGFYSSKKSSFLMSQIKAKNTKPELMVRKSIWSKGFRYRLNYKGLIGKPDLIFVKERVIVFIDGDFWHGYDWEKRKLTLKTNTSYWIPKIERNMQRDEEVTVELINRGWTVLRFWEHEIKKDLEVCICLLEKTLKDKRLNSLKN